MPGNPLTDPNWAANLADTIVTNVEKVRDNTTGKLLLLTRAIVFGLIAAFGGIAAGILMVIGLVRAVISVLEWPFTHPTAVWLTYLALGGIFWLAGALLMGQRKSKEQEA